MYRGWDVTIREEREGPSSVRYWHITRPRTEARVGVLEASFNGVMPITDSVVAYVQMVIDCLEAAGLGTSAPAPASGRWYTPGKPRVPFCDFLTEDEQKNGKNPSTPPSCKEPVAFECGCARCKSEDTDGRYYACGKHTFEVERQHIRVYEAHRCLWRPL